MAVGLFFLVGAWLRVAHLSEGTLGTDELLTLIHARRPLAESVYSLQDFQPPLYPLMVRTGNLIWGGGESYPPAWFLRGPAVAAGCLLVVAGWWYGRSLFGPVVGILTAGAVSLNSLLVFYSREARPYSLFALTAAASMACFYQLMRTGKRPYLIGYVIATVLLFYSHHYAIFCLMAQVAFLAGDLIFGGSDRSHVKGAFFGLFLGVVGSLPAMLLLGRIARLGLPGIWWIRRPWVSDVVDSLGDLIGVRSAGVLCLFPLLAAFWPGETFFDRPRNHREDAAPMSAGGAEVAGEAHWWVRRRPAIYSALWVVCGLWVPMGASMVGKIGFLVRYAVPVAVPLTAAGIYYLKKRHAAILAVVVLGIVGWNVPKAWYYQRPREGIRELVTRLKGHARPDEPIVVVNWAYSDDFISPEIEGMKYYGYDVSRAGVKIVNVGNLSGNVVLDSKQVLPLHRAWVVCFKEAAGPLVRFLADRERAYQVTQFGMVELYELSSDPAWMGGVEEPPRGGAAEQAPG